MLAAIVDFVYRAITFYGRASQLGSTINASQRYCMPYNPRRTFKWLIRSGNIPLNLALELELSLVLTPKEQVQVQVQG